MARRTVAIDPTRDALRAQLAFTSMERARYDVDGRTVLITGGARGIGLASARLLAQRGARLALLDIDDDELERQATPLNAAWAGCDVTDPGAVSAAVDDIVDRLGGIDVVFANAGVEPRVATVLSADPEAWRLVVDVNLHGVFHTVKATVAHVVERRGYLLLNASMYAFMNGALASPYAVSKAGVEQLGKALRTELRPHGATAGVAYFGFIDTALVERTFAQPAVDRLRKALPAFFTSPIAVERAAAAIVDGIERRSAKVMQPRWIPVLQALRGVLGPLDEHTANDPKVHEAIRLAETAEPDRASAPRGWQQIDPTNAKHRRAGLAIPITSRVVAASPAGRTHALGETGGLSGAAGSQSRIGRPFRVRTSVR